MNTEGKFSGKDLPNLQNESHFGGRVVNRRSLIRQLKYSLKNENSIDMALFLNGIPLLTMELKNQL